MSFILSVLALALAWPGPPPMQPADFCGRDAYEPNDTRPYARRLSGVFADGRLCPGDVDWYAIHLEKGDRVAISVLVDRGPATPPPLVYVPGARKPVGTRFEAEGETGTRLTASRTGWYRVRVDGPASESVPYVLLVWPTAGAER
jgi:hypothetical protein